MSQTQLTLTQVFEKLHDCQLSVLYHCVLVDREDEDSFASTFIESLRRRYPEEEVDRLMGAVTCYEVSAVQDKFEKFYDDWMQRKTNEFRESRTPQPTLAEILLYALKELIDLPSHAIDEWIQVCSSRQTDLYVDVLMKLLHKPETNRAEVEAQDHENKEE